MAKSKLAEYVVYTDLPDSLVHAALVKVAEKYGRSVIILPAAPKPGKSKKAVKHGKA